MKRGLRDPIRVAILVEHGLVTDGRTDGQTHDNSIYRVA